MLNELYLKTEIKCYEGKINQNFLENGVPKEGTNQWSFLTMGKNYYIQMFLEECKYTVK